MVADPFNAMAQVQARSAASTAFLGDVWRDHACCALVLAHDDLIEQRPQAVQAVPRSIRLWLRSNVSTPTAPQAATALVGREAYLPQPQPAIKTGADLSATAGLSVRASGLATTATGFPALPVSRASPVDWWRPCTTPSSTATGGSWTGSIPPRVHTDLVDDTVRAGRPWPHTAGPRAFGIDRPI